MSLALPHNHQYIIRYLNMQVDEQQRNVKVVCRFRPLNERERAISSSTVHDLLDNQTVAIKENKTAEQPLTFSFDRIFGCETAQKDVYTYAAASVIESVIEGFNGTIFAYGQTASGKTHTMEGQISKELTETSGIIPRMVKQVFESISQCSANVEFRIKVSIVELYMEKLRDLMDSSKADMKIRSDKKKGIYIENLTEVYISTPEEVYELMESAKNTRAIATTNMNERSSRSHMLFILTISQNNIEDLSAKTGKLYLVDLAGSQRIGKTGAEGKTLDEAKKINISLAALGKVINALTDGKSTHVPYRDSKLTRVLQESLGGNSKTTLIITCSPHANNINETISTLRFGISAKKIKNKPKINKEMTVAELQSLLEKSEKELVQREKYIEQLKNYIVVDLKQKNAPSFSSEATTLVTSNECEETDLIGQLERQLEIERNLNLVQEEQFNNLKDKFDRSVSERETLELQLAEALRRETEQGQVGQATGIETDKEFTRMESDNSGASCGWQTAPVSVTDEGAQTVGKGSEYSCLLQQYNQQKEKREGLEAKIQQSEKTMQKKLNQLENNICQLTHAYYDLLIIQQRHKVDNIFLRKKIEDKDISILGFKDKIKDLEDQNRELEEQRWDDCHEDRELGDLTTPVSKKKSLSKYLPSAEQSNKLNELLGEKSANAPKVVKVVRGGNR